MMAASLEGSRPAGSRLAVKPCRPSGCVSGPTPRDELSRTRVAISTGTPSGLECCAGRAVCGLKLSFAGGAGRAPERLLPAPAIRSRKPAPERLEPVRPEVAGSRLAGSGTPEAKTGQSKAFPSGRKPAARRIDLAFQRMNSWLQVPAGLNGQPGLAAKPRWCYSNLRDAPLAPMLPAFTGLRKGRLTQR